MLFTAESGGREANPGYCEGSLPDFQPKQVVEKLFWTPENTDQHKLTDAVRQGRRMFNMAVQPDCSE